MPMISPSVLTGSLLVLAVVRPTTAGVGAIDAASMMDHSDCVEASDALRDSWNPIGGSESDAFSRFMDARQHGAWVESIDDARYLDFLIRDGVLRPAPASDAVELVSPFEVPPPARRALGAGQDVLEAVEAARSGLGEAEDPVRRWCAVGELPERAGPDESRRGNRFFLGRGRGLAGEIDFERFHQMVFEVSAAVVDRYDATGDGIPDRVVAADIGGVIITVVERQGSTAEGGSFRRGDGREDHCVLRRSAVIAAWIERRRQEGY